MRACQVMRRRRTSASGLWQPGRAMEWRVNWRSMSTACRSLKAWAFFTVWGTLTCNSIVYIEKNRRAHASKMFPGNPLFHFVALMALSQILVKQTLTGPNWKWYNFSAKSEHISVHSLNLTLIFIEDRKVGHCSSTKLHKFALSRQCRCLPPTAAPHPAICWMMCPLTSIFSNWCWVADTAMAYLPLSGTLVILFLGTNAFLTLQFPNVLSQTTLWLTTSRLWQRIGLGSPHFKYWKSSTFGARWKRHGSVQ